ncbi:MAG TPA: hypothetical protein VI522_03935 [Gammaproteobacteria bacterium]|nr:hypothetical protein [Gammaproteobacteria bacterium]
MSLSDGGIKLSLTEFARWGSEAMANLGGTSARVMGSDRLSAASQNLLQGPEKYPSGAVDVARAMVSSIKYGGSWGRLASMGEISKLIPGEYGTEGTVEESELIRAGMKMPMRKGGNGMIIKWGIIALIAFLIYKYVIK